MSFADFCDRALPQALVAGPKEAHRRATLTLYAVAFCVITPIPVAAVLWATGHADLGQIALLGALPSAATLLILHLTKSTVLAGHYLTAWVFLQTALDFGHDNGFSMLAIFAIPIISCSLISERAGMFWTTASLAWVLSIAVTAPATDTLYFGLVWSTAIVVTVIGAAIIVLEQSRTRARVESENANKSLFTQRERLLAFAENAFPAIAETDRNKMLYVSEGITDILGYDSRTFVQRRLNEYVHPDDLPDILRQLDQVSVRGLRCDIRLRHRLGHWVWLEVFAIPHGPEPDRWIFAGRNIESELQQREAMQRSQRLESVGLLAAGLAHDFNNLLTVSLGFSELLPEGESREQIINATTEAGKLTQQLLSFARVDPQGPAATDISGLTDNLGPLLQSVLGERIRLHIEGDSTPLFAAVASGQLHQVLLNLATNAKTAMPGGGDLTIHLSKVHLGAPSQTIEEPLAAGSYAEVLVTDTGIGMDSYTAQHAFDPFFSTKDGSRRSGLGLASVYGIVTNAGGQVTLTSAEGIGTTVRLLIPTAASNTSKREIMVDTNPVYSPAKDRMLLVLEEDISIRTLMTHTLEEAGFTVEAASSREQALQMTETLEPDLLICDRFAAGGRNDQLIAQMRARFPDLRILFTGSYIEADIAEWHALGNVRFLAKPYRSSDLISATRVLLGHSAQVEELVELA